MSWSDGLGYPVAALVALVGLAMAFLPLRAARLRQALDGLFGARASEPDSLTIFLYRSGGVGLLVLGLLIIYRTQSE